MREENTHARVASCAVCDMGWGGGSWQRSIDRIRGLLLFLVPPWVMVVSHPGPREPVADADKDVLDTSRAGSADFLVPDHTRNANCLATKPVP